MKVKVFCGSGRKEIEEIEHKINDWLESGELPFVKNTQSTLSQFKKIDEKWEDIFIVITVWYET